MDLTKLALVLKENGDKILNGNSKFCISTYLLKCLNDSFNLIVDKSNTHNTTFQVIGTTSSKIELLLDLQFLHDFVQCTTSLKITCLNNYIEEDMVDIRKFKNLKLLEIRNIPIKNMLGLQFMRTKLQHLSCIHSVYNLKDLFIDCGGDESDRYIWSELKEVILSSNNISTIDSSLEYIPWLQTLDLSHNKLINVHQLNCLTNLKYLNLSYNLLNSVPLLNNELSTKLQVFVLNNNYVEDINGNVCFYY